jgi:hypothetical protein
MNTASCHTRHIRHLPKITGKIHKGWYDKIAALPNFYYIKGISATFWRLASGIYMPNIINTSRELVKI